MPSRLQAHPRAYGGKKGKIPSAHLSVGKIGKTTSNKNLKKKPRKKPGDGALREIKKYQGSTELLIKKAPFRRLAREISGDVGNQSHYTNGVRWHLHALLCLQEAIEDYFVKLCEDSNLNCIHRHRITVEPKDFQLALRVRGERT